MSQRGFKATLVVTDCKQCPWSFYDHNSYLSRCERVLVWDTAVQTYNENMYGLTDSCPMASRHEEFEYGAF